MSGTTDLASFHRSRVHILLTDKDSKSRQDVLELLRGCSYQVTPVEHARQALELLRANEPSVDLILAEVEGKGYKMLKHIMKEERLKQIPVVMMSNRDEMAIVVRCLRLGAADYLVKPLRTNELLNLWTHMWRRKRMVGMAERSKPSCFNMNDPPFDFLLQDPSESNTASTDLFSEDTEETKKNEASNGGADIASKESETNRCETRQASPALELTLQLSTDISLLKPSSNSEQNSKLQGTVGKHYGTPSPPLKTCDIRNGEGSAFVNFGNLSQKNRTLSPPDRQPNANRTADLSADFVRDSIHNSLSMDPGNTRFVSLGSELHPGLLSLSIGAICDDAEVAVHDTSLAVSLHGSLSSHRKSRASLPPSPQSNYSGHPQTSAMYRSSDEAVSGSGANVLNRFSVDEYPHKNSPWTTAALPMENPGPHGFPMGNHISLMKMRIPPDAIPEMGAMLPPALPPHVPHMPHIVPHHLATALGPMQRLPAQMRGPLMQHPMPPMFHRSVTPHDSLGMSIAASAMMPAHALNGHGHPGGSFPYFSPTMLASSHLIGPPQSSSWPSMQMPVSERKMELAERREAALNKFRQKRKDRCFEKKIRYVSRKKLAEQRPRNRGQFVKQTNDGSKVCDDDYDSDDDDDDENSENEEDVQTESSPDDEDERLYEGSRFR